MNILHKNKLKNLFITFLMVVTSLIVEAQTIDQIKADRKTYIWGEGTGVTLNRADQDALGMLINQISTQVESNFTLLQEEVRHSGKESFQETFKGVINTYTNATLRNTERIVISNEPDAKVFRYVKRNELDKIFSDRERKIIEFARNGQQFMGKGEVAYAVRYFYWSLTLLRSHPNANTISINDSKGEERLLISWLPVQINSIFSDISITTAEGLKDGDLTQYPLNILYKNEPARNFDYSYWTGRDWTNIYSAKNGMGIAEFVGTEPIKEIRFRAEYAFEGETTIDHELRDVMSKLDIVPFRSSYFNVQVGASKPTQNAPVVHNISSKISESITMVDNTKPYQERMNSIMNAIRTRNFEMVKPLFTGNGYEMYKKLVQYGQARIVAEPRLRFIQFGDGITCRSVPMSFHFKNNNRNFIEDVVFHFDKNKKVSSISLGLSQEALDDIIGKELWSEKVRLVIVNFLESYKTAYALKRADYIESIFADDALIIVGSILKTKSTGDNPYQNNQIVKYNRYTKEQYIRNIVNLQHKVYR